MQAHQPKEHPMTSNDTAPKRAVIYARISKDKTGAGVGVGKQESDCRELAARLGFDVTGVRSDNDLTAFKGSGRSKPRPGYKDLLADLRAGRANVVLAWHTDRLHRDMTELEEYITVCGEGRGGVPTYTVRGGDLDLSTSNGRVVARILAAIARGEVEHMIERQKSAKERIRKAGAWQGSPRPFGYRPDGPPIRQGGEGRMAQVPAEAQAIRSAYAQALAGVSLNAIAQQWNAQGLTATRGGSFTGDHVHDALLRSCNAGLISYKGQIVGPGRWEPIVSEDTWRAARAILADPARHTGPGPKPRWLLGRVLICGVCGGTRYRVAKIGGVPKYQCFTLSKRDDGALRVNGCTVRDTEQLEEYIEWVIVEKLRKDPVPVPGVDFGALDKKRIALNAELDELAGQRLTPKQLTIASAPLLDDLDEVQRELSAALAGSPLEEFAGGGDPEKIWNGLAMERKRAVAARLLRVTILPVRRNKKPAGWHPGMPHSLDDTAIKITSPDGTPWGTPD
jgi:site-specific DNA recombinase